MTSIRPLLALAALTLAGSAFAADAPGAYLLIGGGNSHFNNDCAGTTKCDNNGNAFKFAAGWRLGNGIAIEGVAQDFGKSTATALGVDVELKAKLYGIGAAVYGDFSPNWTGSARLGVGSVKMTGSGRQGTVSVSQSESSTQLYAGLAVGYRFTPTVSAELAWDSTRGKIFGETGNISALTLGIGIRF